MGDLGYGKRVSLEVEGDGAVKIEGVWVPVWVAAKRDHGCGKAVPCKVEGERIAAQGSFRDRTGVSLEIEGDGAGVSFEIEGVWVAAKRGHGHGKAVFLKAEGFEGRGWLRHTQESAGKTWAACRLLPLLPESEVLERPGRIASTCRT